MAWNQSGNIKGPKGDKGDPGDDGAAGAPGARGSRWFTGTGAPTNVAGSVVGDQYLDTASGDIYTLS